MLKQQIQSEAKESLKSGDNFSVSVLRMLLAAVLTKEKEKKFKEKMSGEAELSDDEVISVISAEIKKRKDAIVLYEKGGRQELAEKEKKEIDVLQKYLPEQLSASEIQKLVEESVAKTGAKEIKDMGRVMAELNPKIRGRADSSEVSKIVKEILNK